MTMGKTNQILVCTGQENVTSSSNSSQMPPEGTPVLFVFRNKGVGCGCRTEKGCLKGREVEAQGHDPKSRVAKWPENRLRFGLLL